MRRVNNICRKIKNLPSRGMCVTLITVLLMITACSYIKEADTITRVPVIEGAYYVGTDSCIPCHDDIYQNYKKTVHYNLAPFELSTSVRGCESCHGPGSKHIGDKGGTDNIINFALIDSIAGSGVCLNCHKGNPVMDWRANVHALSGIGCNECHKSHKVTAPKMLYKPDPELCFTCHQGKKAQHMLPSHHPLQENKMKCSDCHNNHGSENNNLTKPTLNEVCFECHAEYQGPFVFEHKPVFEDCSICHDPHGTIANNLLKQNQPFLCMRCHKGHRQNLKAGRYPKNSAFLTNCTQCHSQVHGSDLPSQVYGSGLTR